MKRTDLSDNITLIDIDDSVVCLFNNLNFEVVYISKELFNCNYDDNTLNKELGNKYFFDSKTKAGEDIETGKQQYRKIKSYYIVPTVQCNFSCVYCHIQNAHENQNNAPMTKGSLKKIIRKIKENGIDSETEIVFYGGEPLLEADLVLHAIHEIRLISPSTRITIFSNGTMIDNNLCQKLASYNVYVIVSIDGMEMQHNLARIDNYGCGTFNKVLDGYQLLKNNGVKVGISLVMGSHNIDSLIDCIDFFFNQLDPLDLGISTLHLFPDKKVPNSVDIYQLTQKMIEVFKYARSRGLYVEHLFRRIRPFVEKKMRIYDCPSCGSKLLFTPWDTVGFCEAFMESGKYFYNIDEFDRKTSLGYKDWANRSHINNPSCYTCISLGICGGGCPYDAYCENGSILSKDTRKCIQSILIMEWLIKDLFLVCDGHRKVNESGFYIPTLSDRRKIYGNIEIDDSLPLQNYSKAGEIT